MQYRGRNDLYAKLCGIFNGLKEAKGKQDRHVLE